MHIEKEKSNRASVNLSWSFASFAMAFFLISIVLTALVIIPLVNDVLESENNEKRKFDLALEAELFTTFVESQVGILNDLAGIPGLVNAAMLSDGGNPVLVDLLDNLVIGGDAGRIVLQDIGGKVLLQSSGSLEGTYTGDEPWVNRILNEETTYHFLLLGQREGVFGFQISVPVLYNGNVEGVLSAEISVPLRQVFVAQRFDDHIAFKLIQQHVTVATDNTHIEIPREESVHLDQPNVTFVYITDKALIIEKENTIRNTILLVLIAGFGISILLFALYGYRARSTNTIKNDRKLPILRLYGIPIAVVCLGTATSVIAFWLISNIQSESRVEDRIVNSLNSLDKIQKTLNQNLNIIDSYRAFYDSSDSVNRKEFTTFTNSLISSTDGIHEINWIPAVSAEQREDHEESARMDGISNYQINEPGITNTSKSAGNRDLYFPILYSEVFNSSSKQLGFDLATDPNALAALESASRSNSRVGAMSAVLNNKGDSTTGIQVFFPVYRADQEVTVLDTEHHDSRDRGLPSVRGFIQLVVNLQDLMRSVIESNGTIEGLYIHDETEVDVNTIIFGERLNAEDISLSKTIQYAERTWRIEIASSGGVTATRWMPWLVLAVGMVVTVLLTIVLIHLVNRREVVEDIVKSRTAELRMLSSIVANSNDSFMVTDARKPDPISGRRKIVYVNEAFTRQTGYSFDEAVGETPFLLQGRETDNMLVQDLTDSITQGVPFRGEFLYYKKNNESYWVDVNINPIKNEKGEITHYGSVQRNIDDLKLAQIERENLINKLMDSNEELARFAFVCSHDLQEPLRMIRSFTEKLEMHIAGDLVSDEKGKKYLGFITDGAERAQNLITDILAYSSVNNNTQPLEQIDGMVLIESIKNVMRTALEDCGGKITHDDLPVIQGNKTQLYQLFQNLINNALKYQRPDATPHVQIGATNAGEYWQFSVKDNGIGMNQRHLPKIFDVFQRLHRRSEYAGTGVGLSICKKVVERHGGTLRVESELGIGSTFYFSLPKSTHMELFDEREYKVG